MIKKLWIWLLCADRLFVKYMKAWIQCMKAWIQSMCKQASHKNQLVEQTIPPRYQP